VPPLLPVVQFQPQSVAIEALGLIQVVHAQAGFENLLSAHDAIIAPQPRAEQPASQQTVASAREIGPFQTCLTDASGLCC